MKFFRYIRKLISDKTSESIKSFIALSVTLLVFYITIRFTNSENIEFILGELLSFILVLIGVASWETVKKQQE